MSKQYRQENLIVDVSENRAELGRRAGKDAADAIRAAIAAKGEARVIFAAAPSQNETLDALVAEPGIDWTKVVALHMDEYLGLPVGSEARFSFYLKKHCFERVPFKAIWYLDEEKGDDVETMLARYTELLAAGPIDVVCMGIGENGHVAFNDPPVADFNDPQAIKVVELDDVCRQQQVNDGCFAKFADVPEYAMTLTCPTLMRATWKFCIVPAPTKAEAVLRTLTWDIGERCPATILRRSDNAVLYLEPASAAKLPQA